MSRGSLAHYARDIERRWSGFLGRPAVLSPGDWRWISEWHRRGISRELIEECIDAAEQRRRDGRQSARPRSLAYLAPAVEEAWSVVVDGRRSPAPHVATDVAPGALAAWRWRMEQEPAGSALHSLLDRLVAEFEAGADPARIDASLDRGLPAAVAPELLAATEVEAQSRLQGYRSRLSAPQLDAALRRAVTQRLRRGLQLPRLEAAVTPCEG